MNTPCRSSAYPIALALAFFGGCRENTAVVDTAGLQAAENVTNFPVKQSLDELLHAPLQAHPFNIILHKEFTERGFRSGDKLIESQAHQLLDLCSDRGKGATALLYYASENMYPLGLDLDQFRKYLAVLNDANPGLWKDKDWVASFLRGSIGGNIEISPVVAGDRTELRLLYQVRPWEHPKDADYYFLEYELSTKIAGSDSRPMRYSDRVAVTPDPDINWSIRPTFDVQLPGKGEVLEVTFTISYKSVADRVHFDIVQEESPLTRTIRYVRGGDARNAEGKEILVLEDINLRASVSALIAGQAETAYWIDWQKKGAKDPVTSMLEGAWLGKQFPKLELLSVPGIKHIWNPSPGPKQFNGPTLIEIFQMSCGPCLEAMPELQKLDEDWDELEVVALCNPGNIEGISKLEKTPPIAVPSVKNWEQLGVNQFPVKMLLDIEGTVRWIGIGQMMPNQELIQGLINEKAR